MSAKINFNQLIEELEIQMEEGRSFFHLKTGDIVNVFTEDLRAAEDDEPYEHLPEWQQEIRETAIDIIENKDDYIELPAKEDIDEYEIIEEFCLSMNDARKQDILLRAIRGKGAFRRFKDTIAEFTIEDQWYAFRTERLKEIAIKWCQFNGIEYFDKN
ncbi:UPF0158 family protein [Halalkalibacter urbisdiaboli]|uniref:UPF0158 family protein n=1 Tax=Halalkalibacter urbisdiaboli TaxID=1960589 RepID=UPI000B43AB95|nr:UPF0158 family protein [Halalkalibacter urbisdiaboli]